MQTLQRYSVISWKNVVFDSGSLDWPRDFVTAWLELLSEVYACSVALNRMACHFDIVSLLGIKSDLDHPICELIAKHNNYGVYLQVLLEFSHCFLI